jgi:hypothetical protein
MNPLPSHALPAAIQRSGAAVATSETQTNWTLLGCPPLTRHLALAMQSEGVEVKLTPPDAASSHATVLIAASSRSAAIDILLRELSELKSSPGLNSELVTTVMA